MAVFLRTHRKGKFLCSLRRLPKPILVYLSLALICNATNARIYIDSGMIFWFSTAKNASNTKVLKNQRGF